ATSTLSLHDALPIWCARLSLYVGLASVMFGVTLGWLWGVVSAYVGGVADTASQRVVDALMALPPIILALSLMAALGQSVNNVILALTILLTPTASRTLRSLALSIRESPYVEAARAVGCPTWRVIALHVLPNTLATYIVLVTVNISYAVFCLKKKKKQTPHMTYKEYEVRSRLLVVVILIIFA